MIRLRNLQQCLKLKLMKMGEVLRITFCEFCELSSVNGVRYITERGLHWSERIWWIIAIGVSLWMCGTLIHSEWVKWRDNLTIMKDEKAADISEIPFPTVTVCPLLKVTKDKFDLASKFIGPYELHPNLSESDHSKLNAISQICPLFVKVPGLRDNYTDESIHDQIEDMAPKLDYVLNECRWRNKPFKCSKYFVPVMTLNGLCFTFNALNSHDFYTNEISPKMDTITGIPNMLNWNWESGYKDKSYGNEYPLRATETGPDTGLEISFITHDRDLTSACSENDQDLHVILSLPINSRNRKNSNEFDIVVPISTNSLISMEPALTTTSISLQNYNPNERSCFYNSERRLAFFKTYSQFNCLDECLANYIAQQIGCVPFYFPRYKDTIICGLTYRKYHEERLLWEFMQREEECNCLISCKSLRYNPKLDVAKWNLSAMNEAMGSQTNYSGISISKLAIFFKDQELKRVQRIKTGTFADFLAICGGLLGLFLGMTALSIIEIVYYLSLRLFCNMRSQNIVGPTNLDEAGPSNTENNHTPCQDSTNSYQEVTFLSAVKKTAIDFCDNGCFHGVQYITQKGLYWIERLGWFIAIIVSFGVCGYLMCNIWIEWSENPVTMIRIDEYNMAYIPYPAITLCPNRKTLKNKFDISLALKNANNLSDIENDKLKALTQICPILADQIQTPDEYMNESIFSTIEQLSMNIDESTFDCKVFGDSSCVEQMIPVLTHEGLCFTINNLNSHEIYSDAMAPGLGIVKRSSNISGWSLDLIYEREEDEKLYPKPMPFTFNFNLFIGLKLYKNDSNQCMERDEGIKVILTVPGDSLKLTHNYYRVPPSKVTYFGISSKVYSTADAVNHYAPSQRKCFYSFERQLKFFKNYTENNCKEECLANFTKLLCGCVTFSMPRDKETRICGPQKIMCYRLAEKKLRIDNSAEYFRSKCNCMPGCTSIEYTAAIERNSMDEKTLIKYAGRKKFNGQKPAVIAFAIRGGVHVERQQTYTWIGFLSLCGGFLGLFLGMSALSVIEVIYYITLRLFWTFRRLKFGVRASAQDCGKNQQRHH